jgi:hypothetical protein
MVSRGMLTPLAFSERMIRVELGFLSGSQRFLMAWKLCVVVDWDTLGRFYNLRHRHHDHGWFSATWRQNRENEAWTLRLFSSWAAVRASV